MRRFLLAILLLCAGGGVATAGTLDEILKAGEIKVGVNATLAPRALYDEKNQITGFEPEVAAEIAKKLGVKLTLVQVGSPDRIPFVASGKIDFVMGAMSRTAERGKVIDFTVPVHSENYGILTREETGVTKLDDLNREDVTLVQVRGTTMIPVIQQRLPKAKLLLLDNYPDRDRALAQKRADASVDGIDAATHRLKQYPNVKWRLIAAPELGVTWSSLGVAKGNYSLRDWLNLALYELHRDGVVAALWLKWFERPLDTKVPLTPYF
jgi:polar amino acid transport system substrate-binding protein